MPVSKDNAMRICIPRPVTGWILLPLLVSCSSVDATKATRMSAFRPDGSTPTKLSESELANIEEYGVVVEFRKGDEIEVRFVTSGTLAELTEEKPFKLVLQRDLYVLSTSSGMHFSADGENFLPFEQFFDGKLAIGLSVKKEDQANVLSIAVSMEVEAD